MSISIFAKFTKRIMECCDYERGDIMSNDIKVLEFDNNRIKFICDDDAFILARRIAYGMKLNNFISVLQNDDRRLMSCVIISSENSDELSKFIDVLLALIS